MMPVNNLAALVPATPLRLRRPLPIDGLQVRYVVGGGLLTSAEIRRSMILLGSMGLIFVILTIVVLQPTIRIGGFLPWMVHPTTAPTVQRQRAIQEGTRQQATALPRPTVSQTLAGADPIVLPIASIVASNSAPPDVDSGNNMVSFEASRASDGQPDTAWRVPGNGIGESLTISFVRPILLRELRVIPGYTRTDPYDRTNQFIQNRRVRRARFEFSDGSSQQALFNDKPTLQVFVLPPVITSYIRLVILETTEPGSNNPRDYTAISEIVPMGNELTGNP